MDPQVRFPGLEINVFWPGAAPQEVEEQIVARIEEAVSDMDEIEWVRSSSAEGYGGVYILAEQQVDFTQFMNDVKIRVDSIPSFPRDIEPPQVRQWVNRNEFIRVAVHGDLNERELKRLAEQYPKYGCPTLYDILVFASEVVNKKRTYRIYREERL